MSTYHEYIKIWNVCVYVCVSVRNGSGSSGGGTTVVMHDLRTSYTLFCVCVITSGYTRGPAAEADTIREQSGVDHTRLVLTRDTTIQGSLVPRTYQPQCGSLSVSHGEARGSGNFVMFSCLNGMCNYDTLHANKQASWPHSWFSTVRVDSLYSSAGPL